MASPDGLGAERPPWALPVAVVPFAAIGAAAIVAGGICAAVTGPTEWDRGSWVAAFLVLVVGVGQLGLGVGQAVITGRVPSTVQAVAQAVTYNGGAVLVIVGTLASSPALTSLGCALVLAALVLFAVASGGRAAVATWPARLHLIVLIVLIVSTPVGIVLTWIRN